VPASASLSIAALANEVGGVSLADPAALAPGLQVALAGVVDPRQRRGVRHGLVVSAAVCAVAAGARSFVAVAEWVADLPTDLAALGVDRRCPSESTIRRLIGSLDADRFDTVIGAFVQTQAAAAAPAGQRRVLAVDGKTLRGSRYTDVEGIVRPGRHLLAVIDHHTRVVLGQVNVDGKTNEIAAPNATMSRTCVPAERIGCSRSRATSPGCAVKGGMIRARRATLQRSMWAPAVVVAPYRARTVRRCRSPKET
jgi:hypothetical protein